MKVKKKKMKMMMNNKLIYKYFILYYYIIMNYQKKYIKYKNKYLQLQNIINSNNLKGGAASSIDDPKKCSYPECDLDASKTCPLCKSAFYCSSKHQISDWKNHKPFCLANRIKPSSSSSAASSVDDSKEEVGAASSIDDPKEDDPTEPTSMPSQNQEGNTCWAHAHTRSVVRTFQVLNIITDDKVEQWYALFYAILLQDKTCEEGGGFSDMIRLYNYLKDNIDSIINKIFGNPLTEDQIKIKENLKFLFDNELIFPAKYQYAVNPSGLNYPTKAIKNMLDLGLQPALNMTFSVSLYIFLSSKTSDKYDLFPDKDIITDCNSGIRHTVVLKEWFKDHLKIRNSWGFDKDFSVKNLNELICTVENKNVNTIIDFTCVMIDTEKLNTYNFVIKKYRSIIDSTLPITKHNYTDNYDDYGFPHGENCELKDYNNNTFFQGNLIHGIKNGQGTDTSAIGTYEGNWKNDQKHGKGSIKYPSGSVYEGNWVNNKQHGKGKFIYSSGSVYEGDWVNNKQHGKGTFTSASGSIYEGDWVNDKRHGTGIEIQNGSIIYQGNWENNQKHGKGKYTYPDNSKYEGDWKNNKRHGKGIYTYSNGLTYDGNWAYDKKHGQGTEKMEDGSEYTSNWNLDKKLD